jgi:hypothetical protein
MDGKIDLSRNGLMLFLQLDTIQPFIENEEIEERLEEK